MANAQISEREKEIVKLLAADPGTSVTRLAELLGVSVVTIRSDLSDLEQKGILVRTRGGAAPAYHPHVLERQSLNVEAKSRIAQAAAALVNDGDTIMIEAGTTTALVARHLLGKRFVNIVTNSTLILPFARTNPGIHLTVVGGEFRPASESMVGPGGPGRAGALPRAPGLRGHGRVLAGGRPDHPPGGGGRDRAPHGRALGDRGPGGRLQQVREGRLRARAAGPGSAPADHGHGPGGARGAGAGGRGDSGDQGMKEAKWLTR